MPVQITPRRPSNLAQVALQSTAMRDRREAYNAQSERADAANLDGMAKALPQVIGQGITIARGAPEGQRVAMFNQVVSPFIQRAQQAGVQGAGEIAQNFSSMGEDAFFTEAAENLVKGATVISRNEDGTSSLVTNMIDPRSGAGQASVTNIPGELVSKLGETATDTMNREIDTQRGKDETGRLGDLITEGQIAADSLAPINRAISLLDSGVNTDRMSAAQLAFTRSLGIEDPSAGELSNLLGKAVLSQLRATFGAAFTAEEGKQLQSIEASFGRNPATNRRLLENAKAVAMRAAQRGLRAAEEAGDTFAVEELNKSINFRFGGDSPQAGNTQSFEDGTTVEFLD